MADVVGQRVKQEPAGGRQQGGGVRNVSTSSFFNY